MASNNRILWNIFVQAKLTLTISIMECSACKLNNSFYEMIDLQKTSTTKAKTPGAYILEIPIA